MWKYLGLGVAVAVTVGFGIWLLRRRPLSVAEMVLVAATATLVVPLLLPEMHERYFYLGEVLAIVAAVVLVGRLRGGPPVPLAPKGANLRAAAPVA